MKTATPRPTRRQIHLSLEVLESRLCLSSYSIVDLLPPTGSKSSTGLGLNDQGIVVGNALPTGTNYNRPAVWQIGAGATAPGTFLTLFGADTGGSASDVNNSGMIAGTSRIVEVDGPNRAVVWTGGGSYVPHDLGFPAGMNSSQAISLSEPDPGNVTWVVGISESVGAPERSQHATVWRVNASGAVLSAIDLEPTLNVARAKDVRVIDPSPVAGDEYVLVAGEVQLPEVQPAVVWKLDLAGNVLNRTDLGTLGGSASTGYGINNLGHVVGGSQPTTGSQRGFIHKDGVMTNLGTIMNGFSTAYALNDNDVVVGNCATFSKQGVYQGDKAFVWQNGTMLDLRSQLGSAARANWSALFGAFDVNSRGQIVGRGSVGKGNAAQGHGFLMSPPALHANAMGATDDAAMLTPDQAQSLLRAATSRLRAAGVGTGGLSDFDIRIADLGGTTLGLAFGNTIYLDDNAAGWGWFIDPTPRDDSEFTTPGNQGEQGRIDLLTAIAHELGHLLGFDHSEGGVMDDTLEAGIRMPPMRNVRMEPVGVDAILGSDWTGRHQRHRDDAFDSAKTLIKRLNRFGR